MGLLAANLLWLPTLITERTGEGAALGIYAVLRFLIVLTLAFCWVFWAGLRRGQALSGAGTLILAEQFLFRGGSLLYDAYLNPQSWSGASIAAISFSLLMGFLVFLPLVLIVAWMGTEFAVTLSRRSGS